MGRQAVTRGEKAGTRRCCVEWDWERSGKGWRTSWLLSRQPQHGYMPQKQLMEDG